MSSIFSRIIQGEIPSYTVYSDEYVYAFLTIAPHTLGHTLLVPRDEIGNILDVSDDIYSHLMLVAKNILAPAIQRATYCERVGFLVEGFGVPDHAHLHLIPLCGAGDMDSARAHEIGAGSMEQIARKIREELTIPSHPEDKKNSSITA